MSVRLDPRLDSAAALFADASRATMLTALLSGLPLPASELARAARVSPATASAHLGRLARAGLIVFERRGRERLYSLAGDHVAQAIEGLAVLAPARVATGIVERDEALALRFARSCYDHLAGTVGVALLDALLRRRVLVADGFSLATTDAGARWLATLGIDTESLETNSARPLARPCLDWSERRHHLAGSLGAVLLRHLMGLGWLLRMPRTRALRLRDSARRELRDGWGLDLPAGST